MSTPDSVRSASAAASAAARLSSVETVARSPWAVSWAIFRRNRAALLGLLLLSLIALLLSFGSHFYAIDPFEIVGSPNTTPGTDAPLGTDYLGRDVLAGIVAGGRPTLLVGFCAALITTFIGITIGSLSGYYGRMTDRLLGRIIEFFQVLPALLFAMVLITLFAPSFFTVTLAIGLVAWPSMARLTRAEFLRIRQLDFVRSARSIGASDARIILRTILPNALPPIMVSATLATGSAILFEAGLSFLGLTDPNIMSWGLMVGTGRTHLREAWWAVTFPGLCIFFTVLGICLVGDGLNDAFNPKLRQR